MLVQIFQVDAFTRRRFGGNPAAVMILESFLDDARLQDIAAENNLAETAFLVRDGADYRLRWFTPTVEVPLCGHATLASAAVVLERLEPGRAVVTFHSASGPLVVSRSGDGYVMDFPARPMVATSTPEALIHQGLGQNPTETLVDQHNYLAVLRSRPTGRAGSAKPAYAHSRPPRVVVSYVAVLSASASSLRVLASSTSKARQKFDAAIRTASVFSSADIVAALCSKCHGSLSPSLGSCGNCSIMSRKRMLSDCIHVSNRGYASLNFRRLAKCARSRVSEVHHHGDGCRTHLGLASWRNGRQLRWPLVAIDHSVAGRSICLGLRRGASR